MIVDFKRKYIFIGLPHSASSAISKELLQMYGAEPLFHKHANIPLLLRERPDIDISDYFVFAVIRDPVEIVFSVYNKLLTNPNDRYTDPKSFLENGGHVNRNTRKLYSMVHDEGLSFEGYVRMKYRYLPYDNDLSINAKYLTEVIHFETIAEDFKRCLLQMGIAPVRDLPLFNKTNKVASCSELPRGLVNSVFGPFYDRHRAYFDKEVKISALDRVLFGLYQKFRFMKRLRYDLRQKNISTSIDKLLEP